MTPEAETARMAAPVDRRRAASALKARQRSDRTAALAARTKRALQRWVSARAGYRRLSERRDGGEAGDR